MSQPFQQPKPIERAMNNFVGFLFGHGIGPSYARELQVRGRKSGRTYTTPVNILEQDGKLWLVAPRGRAQWTRNAEAAGEVTLKRGKQTIVYTVRTTAPEERPIILKAYLEAYASQVKRFFAVAPGAPVSEFAAIADQHPVFELTAKAAA